MQQSTQQTEQAGDDSRHDFDFYHGRWQVRNVRLRERLVGSDDWETFDATQECRPILDDIGNLDDFVTDSAPTVSGR